MKRHQRIAAAAGITALLAAPAGAALAETTPAPPAESGSVAANVEGIAAVSRTTAKAGPGAGESSAGVIIVNGKPVLVQLGGSQKGDGEAKGALFESGTTPLGSLSVAPWRAKVAGNHSESEAALLKLMLLNPNTARVTVLESTSSADYTQMLSRSKGTSDGAKVNVGGDQLAIVLLHSEADSTGKGKTYVASINGTEILTQNDSKTCTLAIPSAVALACLNVSGGAGKVDVQAAGVSVGDPANATLKAQALKTSVASGSGSADTSVLGNVDVPREDLIRSSAPGGLARTGVETPVLAAIAALLLAAGSTTLVAARRES